MEHNNPIDSEFFSQDPEENLRMENEFLKLKILAETGDTFETQNELSPNYENTVLQSILQSESDSVLVRKKIRDYLNPPHFEPEENLTDKDFRNANRRLQALLKKHRIKVDFIRKRSARFRYNFIVCELFKNNHTYFFLKGLDTHFTYENFYPDNEIEIRQITERFLEDFFNIKITTDYALFRDVLVFPDGEEATRNEFVNEFKEFFEDISLITDGDYRITKIECESLEGTNSFFGVCVGVLFYCLQTFEGEEYIVSGPFIIQFLKENNTWEIYNAGLIGFNLHEE